MSQILINAYLADLDRLRKFAGTSTEQVIREAIKDLLKNWAKAHDLHFVPELEHPTPLKTKVYPDGTIREKFNTYRFADYKEQVADLLARVTRVSVETMEVVNAMRAATR